MRNAYQRLGKHWKEFVEDSSGIAVIYVAAALPVIIGFSLLAIDVGRFSTLQSSLQHGADALALAGAGELDRKPDAITRSNRAIANLVTTNTSLFANTLVTIDETAIGTPCFLEALPATDDLPILNNTCLPTGNATEIGSSSVIARFVRVQVAPTNFTTIFPVRFLGGSSNTAQTRAEAVAGFDAAVCDFTPMFICNPYEASGNTDIAEAVEFYKHFDEVNYPDRIGRLINMKQTGGGSAQYFPGNFGFLTPGGTSNAGASTLRQQVGQVKAEACFVANGVKLRTGNIESIRFGFNTRFDMYDGPFNSEKSNDNYRPAQNVRKGMANDKTTGNGKGTACNADDATSTAHSDLSRDTCFATNSCPYIGGRMGDGVWDKATYWSEAHNGEAVPGPISGANVSRYKVYNYELENINLRVKNDSNGIPLGGEVGYPACHAHSNDVTVITNTPDRRIFYAAVLNCQALNASTTYGPIQGNNSNQPPLPVVAFGRFFLTEPVGGDRNNANVADGDVWAEMVGVEEPGTASSLARDIVQLYR